MKTSFSIIGLAIFFCSLSFADVRMNNTSYVGCDTCELDNDFKQAALEHHMTLFPADSENYRIKDRYVVVNLTNEKLKTIAVTRHYLTGFWSGFRVFSHAEATVERTSFSDTQNFSDYLSTDSFSQVLGESAYSREVNTFYLGEVNFYWLQASMASFQSEINEMVLAANLNPFFFIESKMKVQIRTKDKAKVFLLNTNFGDQHQWQVAFSQPIREANFYDEFGNLIYTNIAHSVDMECFVGYTLDLCRSYSSYGTKNGTAGGSFIGDIHKVGRGVGPLPPPRCVPGSPMCPTSE